MSVDIKELLTPRRRIASRRMITYRRVLELCHRRIRYNARVRPDCNWCLYVVPKFVIGLPLFNVDTCTRYCLAKLRENGFDVTFVPANTILISWQDVADRATRTARDERKRVGRAARRRLKGKRDIKISAVSTTGVSLAGDLKEHKSKTAYLDAPAPRFSDTVA